MAGYFGRELEPVSLDELADAYRARDMMAVLLATDDSTTSGLPPVPNEHVAAAVRKHPDVFMAFGGIDPWKGRLAIDEARRCREVLGCKGLKFNPGRQHFFPNDPRFGPLWQTAADLGLVCLFHTGLMGNGAGVRGGLGFKLKYTAPIPYLDDIAADFPDLTLISAHPGWPWQEEQLAMARHKGNVYIDLSGWAPKYRRSWCSTPGPSCRTASCLGPTGRCSRQSAGSRSSIGSTSTRRSARRSSSTTRARSLVFKQGRCQQDEGHTFPRAWRARRARACGRAGAHARSDGGAHPRALRVGHAHAGHRGALAARIRWHPAPAHPRG